MTRRRSTYPIRCWQMLGTAVVILGAFALIGISSDALAHWFGAR